jgi:Flp pilus assembly pilin Flp
MIARRRNPAHLARNEDGAALIEFAFVAPVFLVMLMATFDIGYGMYIRTIAAGTLEASARAGSLEGATQSQLTDDIRESIYDILPVNAQNEESVVVTPKNYTDYSRIDSAEKITEDHNKNGILDGPETFDENGNGKLDLGDCWLDEDMNGEFGVNEGANGLGGADDSVYYNVTISLPRLFPMPELLGWSEEQSITVKTLIVNQPYAVQVARPTVCVED